MNNKGADETVRAQADLHLCCLHVAKTGFLMTWLLYFYVNSVYANVEFGSSL